MSLKNPTKQVNFITMMHGVLLLSARLKTPTSKTCALHRQPHWSSQYLAPACFAVGLCFSAPVWAKQPFQQSSLPEAIVANCPSVSFFEFISAFADNAVIQRRHTQLNTPIAPNSVSAFAIQKTEYSTRTKPAAMHFPIIPPESQRKAKGVSLRIDDVTDNQAVVVMTSIHTNTQVIYQFQKGSCWNLVEIKNDSL